MTVVWPPHGRQDPFIQHMDRNAKDCMGAARRKDYEGAGLPDTALYAVMRNAELVKNWCVQERAGQGPVDRCASGRPESRSRAPVTASLPAGVCPWEKLPGGRVRGRDGQRT